MASLDTSWILSLDTGQKANEPMHSWKQLWLIATIQQYYGDSIQVWWTYRLRNMFYRKLPPNRKGRRDQRTTTVAASSLSPSSSVVRQILNSACHRSVKNWNLPRHAVPARFTRHAVPTRFTRHDVWLPVNQHHIPPYHTAHDDDVASFQNGGFGLWPRWNGSLAGWWYIRYLVVGNHQTERSKFSSKQERPGNGLVPIDVGPGGCLASIFHRNHKHHCCLQSITCTPTKESVAASCNAGRSTKGYSSLCGRKTSAR